MRDKLIMVSLGSILLLSYLYLQRNVFSPEELEQGKSKDEVRILDSSLPDDKKVEVKKSPPKKASEPTSVKITALKAATWALIQKEKLKQKFARKT